MKLTNGEIFQAWVPLQRISEISLPVRVSLAVAKLSNKLKDSFNTIESVRNSLIRKYGELDPKTNMIAISPESANIGKFADELKELFDQEEEVAFGKIKLPEVVASTCDKCKHNMDKPLEIEPQLLIPLEKFVEV